ncbi:hypothetical protein K3179_03400 [Qipengyuania sp. GH38]|uniref:hypothetical protein n=1 Tax=Qipengyuania intermedia TaxID=2867244 RepID=UPI001C882450|nr:hypothetical protein [Qipengyuania intermedia]MBX7513587.1 hypothetical protein [Qipengyuania intermedia]
MLDRNSATARLTRQMQSTESAVSDALIQTLSLMHTAAMAQRDVDATPQASQAALLRMGKLVEGLLAAQSDAMRVHGQLADIAREVNGPEEPTCPDRDFFTTGVAANAG